MRKIITNFENQRCEIYIGSGLLKVIGDIILPNLSSVAVLSDSSVANIYLQDVLNSLSKKGYRTCHYIIPPGDQSKSLEYVSKIVEVMIKNSCDGESALIGLGGGVVTDMAGFTASCYKRGIKSIYCPTSLLAQVDACIGGKTATNHKMGKNFIGNYYQPKQVFIDLKCLNTLSATIFSEGLSEAVKYALALDLDFFKWLEENVHNICNRDLNTLKELVTRCILCKSEVVSEDFRCNGKRNLLNLGHTYAHAIESTSEYSCSHGQAVAIGLVLSTYTSMCMKFVGEDTLNRVRNLLMSFNLPISIPKLSSDSLLRWMQKDKKNTFKEMYLVVPTNIGSAKLLRVDYSLVEHVLLSYNRKTNHIRN